MNWTARRQTITLPSSLEEVEGEDIQLKYCCAVHWGFYFSDAGAAVSGSGLTKIYIVAREAAEKDNGK